MPQGTHTVELPLSIETIWDFVHDMNKWAHSFQVISIMKF